MSRTSSIALAVLASAVLASSARPAAATPIRSPSPEALERARALSDRGRDFHQRGQYDRAVDSYQEAYVLAPSPGLLFNLGQAYRLKGDCTNATLMYRAYLRSNPGAQPRAIALAHLSSVERCASPSIRSGPAAAGAELRASSPTAPSPAPAPAPGRRLRQSGILTAIGGGVLLGVAGYFALSAADASDEVTERYGRGERWRALEDLDARGQRDSQLALGFAIGGGVAVATGAALYLVGWRQAERGPALSVAPAARGGSVKLAWDF